MKDSILLVDDNSEMLEVLTDELTEDYDVVTAVNGKNALDVLHSVDIQLIICDVMMPVMDGFEFCREIKSKLSSSHIPVILLTARNTLQSRIEGIELGADAYIEKPFSMELLLVQISNLLANRKKLKDYFAVSPVSPVQSMACSPSDQQFLNKLNLIIDSHLDDQYLDVEMLAELLNTSRTSLFRKIKAVTNLTPNELITVIRLKKSVELLTRPDLKIFEIAYMVGFNSSTSFGRSFLKQFSVSPTEYRQQML